MEKNALYVKRFLFVVASFYIFSIPIFIYASFHFSVFSLSLVLLIFGTLELSALVFMCLIIEPSHYTDTDELDREYLETLANAAIQNPKKLKGRIHNIRLQGRFYLIFLFTGLVEGSAGVILLAQSMYIPSIILFSGVVGTGVILVTSFRSLLYKPDFPKYPQEMIATSENFPGLICLFSRLKVSCKAPRIHNIFIVPGDNCSVELYSDFFGFRKRNLLHIGLTLLMYCSDEELSAIIAHEFSHIRKRDTLIGYQAYISRVRWQIVRGLAEPQKFYVRHLLGRFAAFYSDYIAMNFRALAKPKEIEADMLANEIVGKTACVSTLLKSYLLSCMPMPSVDFFAISSPDELPTQTISNYLNGISGFVSTPDDIYQSELIGIQSALLDSHPSLYERFRLLGWEGPLPVMHVVKNDCLDPGIQKLMDFFDNNYYEQLCVDYFNHLENIENDEKIVNDYDGTMEVADYCMPIGWALFRLHRWEETLTFLQSMDVAFPGNYIITYAIACTRMRLGMEEAIPDLMKIADDYPYLIEEVLEEILEFTNKTGKKELLKTLDPWIEEKSVIWREHQRELGEIRSRDEFIAASIPSKRILKPFQEELSKFRRIKSIFLLRKKVCYALRGPLLVGIDVGFANTSKKDVQIVKKLLDEMMPELPYDSYIIRTYEQDPRFFLNQFLGPKGNIVYHRRSYIKSRKGVTPESEIKQEIERHANRTKYKSRLNSRMKKPVY